MSHGGLAGRRRHLRRQTTRRQPVVGSGPARTHLYVGWSELDEGSAVSQDVARHYSDSDALVESIATSLRAAGIDPASVTTADLAGVDEFHIRGRAATLALAESMGISADTEVLDIGAGLGGAARALAEARGCAVTGIDLTPSFCAAASELSRWTGLDDRTSFRVGDACELPFEDDSFDAAMTIHAAMNIPDKPAVYREARRVLRAGGMFGIYDVLQGDGGEVLFPVPWAREPSISHLATQDQMREMLGTAGFELLQEIDSSEESLAWFQSMRARLEEHGPPPVSFGVFLGQDFPQMVANQVANLADGRIRTVSYLCRR
jgi:ubiquinone/menaquinone biosynthesis C-methylase UbiE